MHAYVRQGNGKYYLSSVFGYYRNITETDDHKRYLNSIGDPYWIVWDENRTRLIRWFALTPNTEYLIPQIIIVDTDQNNWCHNERSEGCISFLSKELLDDILDKEEQPSDILEQCRGVDAGYAYDPIQEITSEKEIEDLDWASGGFHDAFIQEEKILDDGTLYLLFDGTWACKVEVWFEGELEYDSSSMYEEGYESYWFDSTVLIQDGFIYLI